MADNCPTEQELHNHAYCPLKVETWTAFTIPPGPTLTGPRFIRLPYPFLSPFPSCSVRGTIYSDVISQKRTTEVTMRMRTMVLPQPLTICVEA